MTAHLQYCRLLKIEYEQERLIVGNVGEDEVLAFGSGVLRISFKGYVDVSARLQFHFVAILIR
jgi:hypothetical protein